MPDISPKSILILIAAVAGIIFLLVVVPSVFGDVFGAILGSVKDIINTARGIKIPLP